MNFGGDLMPVQGELNCMTAIRSGHAGSVGDGPVRDADTLRKLGLPIFRKKSPVGEMMSSYAGALYCAAAQTPRRNARALAIAPITLVACISAAISLISPACPRSFAQ